MKKAIVEMMLFVFLISYMFQPILNEVYAQRSYAVEMVLDSAIEKAAAGDTGRFTPEVIAEMTNMLNKLGYQDSEIEFSGTTTLMDRGQYIEATLSVPHKRLWILENLFGQDTFDRKITKKAKQMSEFIIR